MGMPRDDDERVTGVEWDLQRRRAGTADPSNGDEHDHRNEASSDGDGHCGERHTERERTERSAMSRFGPQRADS